MGAGGEGEGGREEEEEEVTLENRVAIASGKVWQCRAI